MGLAFEVSRKLSMSRVKLVAVVCVQLGLGAAALGVFAERKADEAPAALIEMRSAKGGNRLAGTDAERQQRDAPAQDGIEPDSAFFGTWEMVSLVEYGRRRAGEGRLLVSPGNEGRPASWVWEISAERPNVTRTWVTTREPHAPFPVIRRTPPPIRSFSYSLPDGPAVYRLSGDTLTIAIGSPRDRTRTPPGEDAFQPGLDRTIETYRRVRREADPSFQPVPFPRGPIKLVASWDGAARGVRPDPPRGAVTHYALYDLGDGVRVIARVGGEYLDDPPAPDVERDTAPKGTIVRTLPKFDDKTYDLSYPKPSAEAQAVIDAFRNQEPHAHQPGLTAVQLTGPHDEFLGWDGLLLSAKSDIDRIVAQIMFSDRMLVKAPHGTRFLSSMGAGGIETWELREGRLRYLATELPEMAISNRVATRLIAPVLPPLTHDPTEAPIRPRPAHLAPIPETRTDPTRDR
jgi:hypothetical protein